MLILVAFTVLANIIFILYKFKRDKREAAVDVFLLGIVAYWFHGSFDALAVGTISSLGVSIWLYWNPVFKRKGTI